MIWSSKLRLALLLSPNSVSVPLFLLSPACIKLYCSNPNSNASIHSPLSFNTLICSVHFCNFATHKSERDRKYKRSSSSQLRIEFKNDRACCPLILMFLCVLEPFTAPIIADDPFAFGKVAYTKLDWDKSTVSISTKSSVFKKHTR